MACELELKTELMRLTADFDSARGIHAHSVWDTKDANDANTNVTFPIID
jgi:hypothetical protein